MPQFLTNPEAVLDAIEMKNCTDSKNRLLVMRASLDDHRLRETQLRRAAKHCFECSLCLDIYVYFRTGYLMDSNLQENMEWTSRNFTGAELILIARVFEKKAQREKQKRIDLLLPYLLEDMATAYRLDADEPEILLPHSLENLKSILNRMKQRKGIKGWRVREREIKVLERLYALDSGPELGPI